MYAYPQFLKTLFLSTALVFGFVNATQADEIAIPVGQQGSDKASLERPKVGTTAQKVEAKFGAPIKKSAAIGKPPISIWDYPDFSVYFESDRVIHSVLKPNRDDSAPAPVANPEPVPATTVEPVPASAPAADPAPVAEPAAVSDPAPALEMDSAPAAEDAKAAGQDSDENKPEAGK